MKKMNKKGFTLIELLAVIIILGVLLLIAVPSVSKYIVESRMKTYNTNLSNFVSAVANEVNAMEYGSDYSFKSNEILVVPFDKIEIEKGDNTKSPFAPYNKDYSYVLVTRKYDANGTPTGFTYYVQAYDENGYGATMNVPTATVVKALAASDLIKIPTNEATISGATPTWTVPAVVGTLSDTITHVKVVG